MKFVLEVSYDTVLGKPPGYSAEYEAQEMSH